MAGPNLSHYEMLERVAEGGMGVVYKARDVRLDRLVALKFLPPSVQATPEQVQRFFQEARAISKLNHPNIATIYEVDEIGERPFLAFEYLAGGTLRDAIRAAYHDSGLTPDAIVDYAIQIAEGLAHAHRHGIVHRDVKSENVLFDTEGRIKLIDFGVGRVGTQEVSSDFTLTTGTAAYMSPEQAQGLETDHRSDIFSFGIILHELCTGAVPFSDDRDSVVLYDIINSPVPAVSASRSDLPSPLETLISQLLEKSPELRPQSMEEVSGRLRQLSRASEPSAARKVLEPNIAVLPFVDMSPDKDQEYFCDGIAEEISNALAGLQGLKVVSRTSAFQFKGQAYDVRQIGESLGVDTVVEGSVRKAGEALRVTAQLISVKDGHHLWSQRYDRSLADVFAVQDEIAQAISAQLRDSLAAKRPRPAPKRPASSFESYNAYLEGRFLLNQRTSESLHKSEACFEQAAEIDPRFALAFAGLAEANTLLASGGYHDVSPQGALNEARAHARRAIELDNNCAEAHAALALVLFRGDWNWKEAEREFRRAIELNPSYATAHQHYALFLSALNRTDEAVEEIQRAHELDPLSLIISTGVGRVLHWARRFEEAIEQYRRTISLNPLFAGTYFDLTVTAGMTGRYKEAADAIKTYATLTGDRVREKVLLARLYSLQGHDAQARRELAEVEEMAKDRHLGPVVFAIIHVGLGERERTMDLLEEGLRQRDPLLVYLQCEATFDAIRDHPRYPALIAGMGMELRRGENVDSSAAAEPTRR